MSKENSLIDRPRKHAGRVDLAEYIRATYPLKLSAKTKTNKLARTKLIDYESSRNSILAPCFVEDDAMRIPESLKSVYHKGVKEEDNDSDTEIVEAGKNKAMRLLSQALYEYKNRGLPSRMIRQRIELSDSYNASEESRERTRKNSLKEQLPVNWPQ